MLRDATGARLPILHPSEGRGLGKRGPGYATRYNNILTLGRRAVPVAIADQMV